MFLTEEEFKSLIISEAAEAKFTGIEDDEFISINPTDHEQFGDYLFDWEKYCSTGKSLMFTNGMF